MEAFTWQQVHAWRVRQHGLFPRFPAGAVVTAATETLGVQAQVLSAAELALCARVEGLVPRDVQAALWDDRTLVKTWAMRGTLHLLAAHDLPLYVAARSVHDAYRWSTYFAYYGLSPAQQDAFFAAVPQVVGATPLTREELANAVAAQTGISQLRDLILSSGWGTPLKPSAFRGDLCFGPSRGQQVTFVNPRAWFGMDAWPFIEPEQALQEVARRYLRAYGPATAEDFARWWGGGRAQAKRLFQSLADELAEVEVEGWRAVALRESLASMRSQDPLDMVHLLPLFDAYTIGAPRDHEPLLASSCKGLVYRPQGWVSAVVLVNGTIQGVWRATTRNRRAIVTVEWFSPPSATTHDLMTEAAHRLRDVFATEVVVDVGRASSAQR